MTQGRLTDRPVPSARRRDELRRWLPRLAARVSKPFARRRWLHSYRGVLWQLALIGGAIAALAALAGVLFVVGFSLGAVGRDFTRGIAFAIGSAVVLGVAGAVYFAGWTRRRATRRILTLAHDNPVELFHKGPAPKERGASRRSL